MPFLFAITECSVGGSEFNNCKTMGKNYWMHRCTCGDYAWPFTSELLKKHKLISIGWNYLSDSEIQSRLTDGWESFNQVFLEENEFLPRNRYNLWRFLNEMHTGDIVVVPLPQTFNVYRIADDVVYNNTTIDHNLWVDWNGEKASLDKKGYPSYADGRQIDMGFYRKVKEVAIDIPRNGYALSRLYSRMKIRQTNTIINDLKMEVDEAISRYKEKKPINIKNEFVEKASSLLLDQIQKMSHDQLTEQLVNWYMKELGGETEIPNKNESSWEDGDVDVIAHFDRLNELEIYVQVKHHSDASDEEAVLQLERFRIANKDTLQNGQYQMWVISTCDRFREAAIKRASEMGIRLIDGPCFARMLVENGVYSLPF